ncbi:8843_t:CDS:2 [Funneliformis mosseae]|uniref:8843_t:CDS:1 n=1 Tax=Funneliformis mosseae TaxID=27381 RepID=A0A9N8ZS63_FUNMO|nr:8843_t:CDS:2 [Funneliformis mosseae]
MSEDMLKDLVSRNVDVLVEETPQQLSFPPPSSVKQSIQQCEACARNNISMLFQFQVE